jgi:hypothetical protein
LSQDAPIPIPDKAARFDREPKRQLQLASRQKYADREPPREKKPALRLLSLAQTGAEMISKTSPMSQIDFNPAAKCAHAPGGLRPARSPQQNL